VTRTVALLRGINVAGHNRLPMAELRSIAEGLGFEDARTHVQSGNLVFDTALDSADAGERLRRALDGETGADIDVVTRTSAEWGDVIDRNPFRDLAAEDGKLVHVTFLDGAPGPVDVDPDSFGSEAFALDGREVFMSLPGGIGRSRLAAALDRALADRARTTRNWNTVLAVARLLED
jgi:uncharacterized protein (DUF1697 family)